MNCGKRSSGLAMKSILVVLVMAGLLWHGGDTHARSSEWNYGKEGPKSWRTKFEDCGGAMQSPVNIDTANVIFDKNLKRFDLSDYRITEGVSMKLENVGGHTAEVVVKGTRLYITQGGLPAKYILEQFHFHWGSNASRGSEHSIDNQFYPMEIHFVHRQERFPTIGIAASKPFGLAVIAFLFKIGKKNEKYQKIVENLCRIPNANDEVEIEPFPISDLIPSTDFDFYRYQGSLTTPPCSESVIWTVAVNQIEVSEEQIETFRSLHNEDSNKLVDDFRPIQALNYRTVMTTKKRE